VNLFHSCLFPFTTKPSDFLEDISKNKSVDSIGFELPSEENLNLDQALYRSIALKKSFFDPIFLFSRVGLLPSRII